MNTQNSVASILVALVVALVHHGLASAAISDTTLVSVSNTSAQSAAGPSRTGGDHALSASGRYLVFSSSAADLVDGDTNGVSDVFVRDRKTGTTSRVSVDSGGGQGNADSFNGSISDDGRYVAFTSLASNLVNGDINELRDIFLHDRKTGATTVVSVDARGLPAGGVDLGLSADGRFVAYSQLESGALGAEILIYDRTTRKTQHVAMPLSKREAAPPVGTEPALSADGRYLVFTDSTGIPADDNPEDAPADQVVYRYDRLTGAYVTVSASPIGVQRIWRAYAPSISATGRYVAFGAYINYEDQFSHFAFIIYVRDVQKGTTSQVSVRPDGGTFDSFPLHPAISADGRYIAFVDFGSLIDGTFGGRQNIYVRDRFASFTRFINHLPSDGSRNTLPSISADGRTIAYTSDSPNLVANDLNHATDVFAYDVPQRAEIRINTAGAGFTDSLGRFWAADRGFNTGAVSTYSSPIANTSDDTLYQTERWDAASTPELQYNFAVPNGTYQVKLHFAENYARNFGVGRRTFGVNIEGVRRFDHLDVFQEAGGHAALVKTAETEVTDGRLDIQFLHQQQNPFIDAIEIFQE